MILVVLPNVRLRSRQHILDITQTLRMLNITIWFSMSLSHSLILTHSCCLGLQGNGRGVLWRQLVGYLQIQCNGCIINSYFLFFLFGSEYHIFHLQSPQWSSGLFWTFLTKYCTYVIISISIYDASCLLLVQHNRAGKDMRRDTILYFSWDLWEQAL